MLYTHKNFLIQYNKDQVRHYYSSLLWSSISLLLLNFGNCVNLTSTDHSCQPNSREPKATGGRKTLRHDILCKMGSDKYYLWTAVWCILGLPLFWTPGTCQSLLMILTVHLCYFYWKNQLKNEMVIAVWTTWIYPLSAMTTLIYMTLVFGTSSNGTNLIIKRMCPVDNSVLICTS